MKPSRMLRKARAKAEEVVTASAFGAARDRAVIAAAIGRPEPTGPHVLVASAGAGNIGDQAMLDAFVERVDGPVMVIARGVGDFRVPEGPGRVSIVDFPELVYGLGGDRRAELTAYGAILSRARSLSVIGADIMDGRYSPRASVRRSMLAEAAAAAGIPARILGFSWNAAPHPRALAALRRAAGAGVVPYLRDPISADRARAAGIPGVVESADLVFTALDEDPRTADALLGTSARRAATDEPTGEPGGEAGGDADATAAGDRVVLVNVSALVGRNLDQAAQYERIVRALRTRGLRVVLVPHVSRPTSDDVAACRAVHDRLADDPGVLLVDRLLEPAEIRGLAARASLTVTGRMHLAIMSLRSGVPAITLATQGKVEGLMRLVGVPDLCVEPGPALADRVLAVVDRLDAEPALRRTIAASAGRLRTLAERNTDGLVDPAVHAPGAGDPTARTPEAAPVAAART
ncbi:polysaccharide pyruvyl transferase family protein [Agromyces sp. MMS24-JH15]|uniref:polysaccharide pyruvyl transferase family protein n=1 Tax=Agromyces sp. MMS24-JH15 TaxID=3243765 RepID=UPI0037479104